MCVLHCPLVLQTVSVAVGAFRIGTFKALWLLVKWLWIEVMPTAASTSHKVVRFISLTPTWWRLCSCLRACVYRRTNKSITIFHVPLSHTSIATSKPVQWLLCFATNPYPLSLWQQLLQRFLKDKVSLCAHANDAWLAKWESLQSYVYRGRNLCEHEGKHERAGPREAEEKNSGGRFTYSSQIFPLLVIKKT